MRSAAGSVALCALYAMLAACSKPPLKIIYDVADGATQSCGSDSCSDVKLACDAVLNVRIVSPSDPGTPYVSICQSVPPDHDRDLCSISQIDLPQTTLPDETLEVQVMVWPLSQVADPVTGELDCRKTDVQFDDSTGFPLDQVPAPAIGGRAYFHPGDSETVVTMGCTDLAMLDDPSCSGGVDVPATATVSDFDTRQLINGASGADDLRVSIGEPKPSGDAYTLSPDATRALLKTQDDPTAAWGANVDLMFTSTVCLEVLDETPEATTSLTCRAIMPGTQTIDIEGYRMSKTTLEQIVSAASLPTFPDAGLTIGIVVDENSTPQTGSTVTATAGTVRYLSADRMSLVPDSTADSGIFVSTDAPYGTTFTSTEAPARTVTGIGGLVQGKVTIVILRFGPPSSSS